MFPGRGFGTADENQYAGDIHCVEDQARHHLEVAQHVADLRAKKILRQNAQKQEVQRQDDGESDDVQNSETLHGGPFKEFVPVTFDRPSGFVRALPQPRTRAEGAFRRPLSHAF